MRRRSLSAALAVVSLFSAPIASSRAEGLAHRETAVHRAPRCPTPTGTVRFSDWQFPDTLNPIQSRLLVTNEVDAGILDGLFVYDYRGTLRAVVAASVPTTANGGIRNGGRTVTIHLRHRVRWSNGSEITSADIRFSLAVGKDRASGPYCTDSCDVISRVDTPDRYTAVLHLKHPYAPILAYGLPVLWPRVWNGAWNNNPHAAAEKLWNDPAFNFEGPNFPTNGPYQVAPGGFQAQKSITLRPMRYYHTLACAPHLAHVVFAYYPSKYDMINAAAKHRTDITQDYTLADASSLRRHSSAFHVYRQPAYSFEHLELNTAATYRGKPNPLASADVRVALALALNRTAVAQTGLGLPPAQARAIQAWSPLVASPGLTQPFADPTLHGQWDPIARRYLSVTGSGQALKDARTLLARTPFKGGFTLALRTLIGNPLRQAEEGTIAQQWSRLAVKVATRYIPSGLLFGDWASGGVLSHGQFQVALYGSTTSPDPDELRYNIMGRYCARTSSSHTDLNANYSCAHDKIIDRAFQQGADTLNLAARARAYRSFERQLNRMAYWIPLFYRPQLTTADNHVVNFHPNPTQATSEWNMSQWRAR